MRRTMFTALCALLLGCLLAGCMGVQNDEPMPGAPVTATPYNAKEAAVLQAAIDAYDGPRGTDIPLTIVAQEQEDVPQGGISLEEAHRLLAEGIRPEETHALKGAGAFEYLYWGMQDCYGERCFLISFGESTDDSYATMEDYLVGPTGKVYTTSYERGFPQYDLIWTPG